MKLYVLDWFTNKNIEIIKVDDESFSTIKTGDKIVYNLEDKNNTTKLSIGINLGHEILTDRKGTFERKLEGEDKEFFEEQQKFALDIFPLFKDLFKKNFKGSIPVTARFNIYGDQIYFYFYSEERYVFTDFVKGLREKLGKNIFLFQVGARDMVKMSPGTDHIAGCNGLNLCCKSSRALPSVEMENIILQNLEGRDIERLKGRCGKLKCSLIYELELYTEESKKYPPKGSEVDCKSCEAKGYSTSYNIMTGEVTIKTSEGETFRVPVGQLKIIKAKIPEHIEKKENHKKDNKDNLEK
ncbi:MAG: regulatory iron-sulfur-containing complex subunit RicT [Candidatus Absconditicoccaceae bacterium]